MRIACPGCAAEYEVPSASLNPLRKVRCTRCGTEWIPVQQAQTVDLPALHHNGPHDHAPHDATAHDPQSHINDGNPTERPGATQLHNRSVVLRAAWIVSVLVLAGSAVAVVTMRAQLTRAWPASAWLLGAVDQVTPPADPSHVHPDPVHNSAKPEKAD